MSKPNFFIVGVPRSGTTSIWNYLKQHEEVFMPKQKYPRFFGEDPNAIMPHIHQDKEEYLKLFRDTKGKKAIGEASHYWLSKTAPEEIKNFNPKSKIIIILRNPADVLYSYLFSKSANPDKIGDFLFARNNLLYSENLERYIKVFGRENVHIIILERFSKFPQEEFDKICDFLEIKRVKNINFKVYNAMTEVRNMWIHNIYFKIPSKKRYAFLDCLPKWSYKILKSFYKVITQGNEIKEKISWEEKEVILYWYKEEIEKTEKILETKLIEWRIK